MSMLARLGALGGAPATYIEDVFSTYLYTGTGAAQTITNGIDLAGKGGMVWTKSRSATNESNFFFDTNRGVRNYVSSNTAGAQTNGPANFFLTSFNANGYSYGQGDGNQNGFTYASWTFRKQAKFFDVVTYTGNGTNRTIAHNLGSVPGCIIIKRTDTTANWQVYHRSLANTEYMVLNTTDAKATGTTRWNSTTPTSTEFSVGTDTTVNANGGTYIAYLFAHDAGGFGQSGSDNVISCGSFTTDGGGYADVSLGYEPQWILIKASSSAGSGENWITVDNMRGLLGTGTSYQAARLYPNLTNAEVSLNTCQISSTGFKAFMSTNITYSYIAIRRPMNTPTTGTSVFSPVAYTGNGTSQTLTTNFAVDLVLNDRRDSPVGYTYDRLRGTKTLLTVYSNAEGTDYSLDLYNSAGITWATGKSASNAYYLEGSNLNVNAVNYVSYAFRRATGFFDVVCYTGTGSARTVNHNLGVVPELMIVKQRSAANDWQVYSSALANTEYLVLNTTAAKATGATRWNSTTPTSTVFSLGTAAEVNTNTATYVAYLFASCPGVSKVGTYTGNGSSQTINCGFTGGARFVMIKRTDSTGDWYVWDTARGIVANNDPHLSLNTTAAEVTTDDSIDTNSTGFVVNQVSATNINVSSATYIYLAIA